MQKYFMVFGTECIAERTVYYIYSANGRIK